MTAPEHDPAVGSWACIVGATPQQAMDALDQATKGIVALAHSMIAVEYGLTMPQLWDGDQA